MFAFQSRPCLEREQFSHAAPIEANVTESVSESVFFGFAGMDVRPMHCYWR